MKHFKITYTIVARHTKYLSSIAELESFKKWISVVSSTGYPFQAVLSYKHLGGPIPKYEKVERKLIISVEQGNYVKDVNGTYITKGKIYNLPDMVVKYTQWIPVSKEDGETDIRQMQFRIVCAGTHFYGTGGPEILDSLVSETEIKLPEADSLEMLEAKIEAFPESINPHVQPQFTFVEGSNLPIAEYINGLTAITVDQTTRLNKAVGMAMTETIKQLTEDLENTSRFKEALETYDLEMDDTFVLIPEDFKILEELIDIKENGEKVKGFNLHSISPDKSQEDIEQKRYYAKDLSLGELDEIKDIFALDSEEVEGLKKVINPIG